MDIVFMGTSEFAVETLKAITASEHHIKAVVTIPDRKKGRGQKLSYSPVKEYALAELQVPVLQPDRLNDDSFVTELKELDADVFVVVAFRILPEKVFSIPPKGTVNLHASLLPDYRGAAPINWALINGESVTGVTTFLIARGVDTGNLLLQKEVIIRKDETAGELHDRLAELGAGLMIETLDALANNSIVPTPQPSGSYKPAPKLTPELIKIDWQQDAVHLKNFIHGLSPYPAAYTVYKEKKIKIFEASVFSEQNKEGIQPGMITQLMKRSIVVQTGKGQLEILSVRFPGKKRISVQEALKGYGFSVGDSFL